MRLDRGAQLIEPGTAARREGVLVDVRGVQGRLGGEQAELAEEPHGRVALARLARAAPGVQLLHHAVEQYDLRLGLFVARARRLARLLEAPLDHREIRERQLARDDVMVKRPRRDRKSTRLNSSHLVISYAVF